MEPERTSPPARTVREPRNWFALAALWTLGATWLGGIGTLYYAELLDNDVSENVAWVLLAVGTIGFILTLAGFTAARTRGDAMLAWVALALALAFVTLGAGPFLFYGLGE